MPPCPPLSAEEKGLCADFIAHPRVERNPRAQPTDVPRLRPRPRHPHSSWPPTSPNSSSPRAPKPSPFCANCSTLTPKPLPRISASAAWPRPRFSGWRSPPRPSGAVDIGAPAGWNRGDGWGRAAPIQQPPDPPHPTKEFRSRRRARRRAARSGKRPCTSSRRNAMRAHSSKHATRRRSKDRPPLDSAEPPSARSAAMRNSRPPSLDSEPAPAPTQDSANYMCASLFTAFRAATL